MMVSWRPSATSNRRPDWPVPPIRDNIVHKQLPRAPGRVALGNCCHSRPLWTPFAGNQKVPAQGSAVRINDLRLVRPPAWPHRQDGRRASSGGAHDHARPGRPVVWSVTARTLRGKGQGRRTPLQHRGRYPPVPTGRRSPLCGRIGMDETNSAAISHNKSSAHVAMTFSSTRIIFVRAQPRAPASLRSVRIGP
jgi:hypothetical protein